MPQTRVPAVQLARFQSLSGLFPHLDPLQGHDWSITPFISMEGYVLHACMCVCVCVCVHVCVVQACCIFIFIIIQVHHVTYSGCICVYIRMRMCLCIMWICSVNLYAHMNMYSIVQVVMLG